MGHLYHGYVSHNQVGYTWGTPTPFPVPRKLLQSWTDQLSEGTWCKLRRSWTWKVSKTLRKNLSGSGQGVPRLRNHNISIIYQSWCHKKSISIEHQYQSFSSIIFNYQLYIDITLMNHNIPIQTYINNISIHQSYINSKYQSYINHIPIIYQSYKFP